MNYDEAVEYIHSIKKYTTKPGLSRIEGFLEEIGNPERKMKYVHVAGTNGKGSSTAMMSSILMEAGYKVGMFISPYLERFNERIQINGEPIPDDKLAELVTRLKPVLDGLEGKGKLHPTEFEVISAIAFQYWAENNCDFVSLEVGMGGRLDATNVIPPPDVAMIISISLDHCHYLGYTLKEIAWEKSGIIKPGSAVVCYANQPKEAYDEIARNCEERGVPMTTPDKNLVEVIKADGFGTLFRYKGLEIHLPLMGLHQVYNAIGVIEAAWILRDKGYNINDEIIKRGIENTKWVGRLEVICENPYCVIDAAHNPDAVKVLSDAIDSLFADKDIVSVMGMLADKDYAYCIPEIAKRSKIIIATTPTSGRALEAAETARISADYCPEVYTAEEIESAVDKAFALASEAPGRMVLICGSLYVIGIAKTYINHRYNGK